MADELSISGRLAYSDDDGLQSELEVNAWPVTLATPRSIHAKMNVTTGEVVVPLGPVVAPTWAMFRNLDLDSSTYYIELRVGTGGAKFAKLLPGETAGPFRLGSGAQAPYAIATGGTVEMEYLVCEL